MGRIGAFLGQVMLTAAIVVAVICGGRVVLNWDKGQVEISGPSKSEERHEAPIFQCNPTMTNNNTGNQNSTE
jgi:hypothetical protein